MSKLLYLIIPALMLLNECWAQGGNTDVPPPPPPPPPPCRLVFFSLPPCVDRTTYTRDIATWRYNRTGCPDNVVFAPNLLELPGDPGTRNINVTATSNGTSLTDNITAVNTNSMGTIGVSFDFSALEVLDDIFSVGSVIGICDTRGSLFPQGQVSGEAKMICCPQRTPSIRSGDKYSGGITLQWGTTCRYPVIPITVGSIDLVLSAEVSLAVNFNNEVTCNNDKICSDIEGSINAGGGVGFRAGGEFLEGSLQAITSASFSGEKCTSPEQTCNGTLSFGGVKIVGTVTSFWGFFSTSVEVQWTEPSETSIDCQG